MNGPQGEKPLADQLEYIYGKEEEEDELPSYAESTAGMKKEKSYVRAADTAGDFVEKGSETIRDAIVHGADYAGRAVL